MIDLEEYQERISQLKESIYKRIEVELDHWVVDGNIMKQIEKLAEDSVENYLTSGGWFDLEDEENLSFDDTQFEEDSEL